MHFSSIWSISQDIIQNLNLFTDRKKELGGGKGDAVPCGCSKRSGKRKVNEIFTKCPSSGLKSD